MAATKLTARFCESIKPVAGKQAGYPDAQVAGLELRVSGEGRKSWSFRYRTREGRQCRLTLGVFSDQFDLERARKEATKARVLVDEGRDPADVIRTAKAKAKADPIKTFEDLAQAYFKACERGEWAPKGRRKRAVSIANDGEVYRLYVKAPLGKLKPEAIKWPTVKAFLRALIDRGVTTRVNRAHSLTGQIFTFGVAEELIDANPISGRPKLVEEKPRERVYSDAELKAIWDGLCNPSALRIPAEQAARRRDKDRVHVGPAMCVALKLTMMLPNRRSEIAGMAIDELDFDQGLWRVPAERMKTNRPLLVPMSADAIGMVRAALALHGGRQTPFVFPSPVDARKPIGGAAMSHALTGIRQAVGITGATVHDIRRTISSALTSERIGISPFIRSKVLGHTDAGGGAAVSSSVYDSNSYLAEKRRALDAWQQLLLEIVGERVRPSNVTPLREAVA